MNRDKRFDEWTGINDSLNAQQWMIWLMNRNEWLDEWTVMNDSLNG